MATRLDSFLHRFWEDGFLPLPLCGRIRHLIQLNRHTVNELSLRNLIPVPIQWDLVIHHVHSLWNPWV